jgi:excisionase family DNA binding protein
VYYGHVLDALNPDVVDESRSLASTPDEPRLRTRREAAQFLKVSVNTVDRLRYQRALSYYRIGGTVRFGPWDLIEFISGRPVYPEQIITNTQRTLTKQELARFLCVSVRTVEHLIQTHGLWRRCVGRLVRFRVGDVLSQLAISFRVQARATTSTEPP